MNKKFFTLNSKTKNQHILIFLLRQTLLNLLIWILYLRKTLVLKFETQVKTFNVTFSYCTFSDFRVIEMAVIYIHSRLFVPILNNHIVAKISFFLSMWITLYICNIMFIIKNIDGNCQINATTTTSIQIIFTFWSRVEYINYVLVLISI